MGLGANRRTVLVTGAAGFLGSHLVDRLLAEGYEVIGLDNLMTGDLTNLSDASRHPQFHFQVGDVREPLHVYAEIVFNMACPASPVHYQHDPYATFTTSVGGAQRLIELARGRRCRIVHASTSEVYGDPAVHPQPETYWGHVNPLGRRACYDEGKRGAETLLNDARRCWGVDSRIVRIFNTYGPRMAVGDGRVVSNFIIQALQAKPITLFGDGGQDAFLLLRGRPGRGFDPRGATRQAGVSAEPGQPIRVHDRRARAAGRRAHRQLLDVGIHGPSV